LITDRRHFLRLTASTAGTALVSGVIPLSIARALAIPADRATGSILDVRHVVILVTENRAFDHYFGTLKGVRGFGDPHPCVRPRSPIPNFNRARECTAVSAELTPGIS
jgi:phospholipase C